MAVRRHGSAKRVANAARRGSRGSGSVRRPAGRHGGAASQQLARAPGAEAEPGAGWQRAWCSAAPQPAAAQAKQSALSSILALVMKKPCITLISFY